MGSYDATLIPWQAGRTLAWDVTVVDTLAGSRLSQTSSPADAAAELAAQKRLPSKKACQPLPIHPLAFETPGPIYHQRFVNPKMSLSICEVRRRS